jgi:hypothetical protein
MLAGACALLVLNGQWAPPTILGFAVFGAGLALAAAPGPDLEEDLNEAYEDLDDNTPVQEENSVR